MGKRERQEAERSALEEQKRVRGFQDEFINEQRGELEKSRARADVLGDEAHSAFKDMTTTGGYDPNEVGSMRDRITKQYNSGGYDNPEQLRTRLQENSMTGGYDPTQLTELRKLYAARQDSGGYDPTQLESLRKSYKGFIDTGGFTGDEEAAFRRHATAGVPATYNVMAADLSRKQAITGGYAGGGETSQMARQMAQEAAKASTSAEVSLAEQKRAGRVAGLTGSSALEGGVATGYRDILSKRGALEGDVAAAKQKGLGAEMEFEGNIAANRQKAIQAQVDLESGVASNRIKAAGGLAELYGTDRAYVEALTRNIIDTWSTGGKLSTDQTAILEALSRQPGLFQNIMQGIATVGGVASNFVAPKAPTGGGNKKGGN